MADDEDLPRRNKKVKRRGEDPEFDALIDELAKETGDPLFWDVSKYVAKEKKGPGVIVAGGLDEAKAHVKGIRPPAGARGESGDAGAEKRVVVATEVEPREVISAAMAATRKAAQRGIESARREEAERAKGERAGAKGSRWTQYALWVGVMASLFMGVVSLVYALRLTRRVEPAGSSGAAATQAAASAVSVAPGVTQAAPGAVATSEAAPAASVIPTSAPAPQSASSSSAASSSTVDAAPTPVAPAAPKASAKGESEPYAPPSDRKHSADPDRKREQVDERPSVMAAPSASANVRPDLPPAPNGTSTPSGPDVGTSRPEF